MEPIPIQVLLPLTRSRFASFADAAAAALSALADAVPGAILMGQLEPDAASCRVMDVRGHPAADVSPGDLLPLAAAGDHSPPADQLAAQGTPFGLDRDFLRTLSIGSELSVPLEMSDGNQPAILCVLAEGEGAYGPEHVVLLGLAARLLSHEWESVRSRVELRRMRQLLRDDGGTDPATGLPNRGSLLDLLTREWQLGKRGTVQSMVVASRVELLGEVSEAGPAATASALKDAAEVLARSIRSTDHAGRTGEMGLAAVLVGCADTAGAEAFIHRYESALARATQPRATPVAVSCASYPLAEASSPMEALEAAEAAVLALSVARNGGRAQQEVEARA